MPPQLDLLVALLELAAFFLITPEIIGRSHLEALFSAMGRLSTWLRTFWFSPDFGPVPPSTLAFVVVFVAFGGAVWLGLDLPQTQSLVIAAMAPVILIPAAYVVIYLFLQALHRRERLGRNLAILGALLFVTGRLIVIASAYSRLLR